MESISSKGTITSYTQKAIQAYHTSGPETCATLMLQQVLNKKVRFPLLEHAGRLLAQNIPEQDILAITDHVTAAQTIGGNVIAGIVLQERLPTHLPESFRQAETYIIAGNEWYVCDIIGERVLGHGLLTQPQQALPLLQTLAHHSDEWMVRVIGVAGHYAVKKGLSRIYVAQLFELLLSLRHAEGFHTRKGIGWAAKTVAKFHPGIIAKHQEQIADSGTWFQTKISIGLSRNYKYAHRYNS
jgi:3-methyladenine DNA glycosylase AlkD